MITKSTLKKQIGDLNDQISALKSAEKHYQFEIEQQKKANIANTILVKSYRNVLQDFIKS